MLEIGDRIVHPRYGAGVVTGFRTMTYSGTERRYYCIELVADRGVVMIPEDTIDETEMRTEITGLDMIRTVMERAPVELDGDYRVRQHRIREKLRSGEPRQIIQALRDLCYRERVKKLTPSEEQMKARALSLLADELALRQGLDVDTARLRLNAIIQSTMQTHIADTADSA